MSSHRLNLHRLIWGSLILQLLVVYEHALPASNISLQTFIGCAVREFRFVARKPGCKKLRITTDACWGRCETWELLGIRLFRLRDTAWKQAIQPTESVVTNDHPIHKHYPTHEGQFAFYRSQLTYKSRPILDPPYIEAYHRVCTYNETKFVTVKMPNCLPDVEPFYTYPVALRCDCDLCSTTTTECETL